MNLHRRKREYNVFSKKKKIAGPHLSYIRKLKMSRVSIHEHTETHKPFYLTDGADLEIASPNKVKLAAVPVMTGLQSGQVYHG